MAHPKLQQIRRRYSFCCGYCGVSETGAGGELTVDHYCPVSAGGGDEDDNLVYACWRCNLYKYDFWPDAPDAIWHVLHPLRDDIAFHLHENVQTGRLESLTVTGRAHIEILKLNRSLLVAHRLHLQSVKIQEADRIIMEAMLAAQQRALAQMSDYITDLRQQVAHANLASKHENANGT